MGNMALAQMAELLLRCAAELRRLEGNTLHCWVTRQDLATHLEELLFFWKNFFFLEVWIDNLYDFDVWNIL